MPESEMPNKCQQIATLLFEEFKDGQTGDEQDLLLRLAQLFSKDVRVAADDTLRLFLEIRKDAKENLKKKFKKLRSESWPISDETIFVLKAAAWKLEIIFEEEKQREHLFEVYDRVTDALVERLHLLRAEKNK